LERNQLKFTSTYVLYKVLPYKLLIPNNMYICGDMLAQYLNNKDRNGKIVVKLSL